MYITGIIAEYNPFHNGHLYHLKQAEAKTSSELIIVVMSGSFMQRGMPAVVDKWTRARMALEAGADLVIELPVIYSCSSASGFAYGAILALEAAGADCFVCGAENDNLELLNRIAAASYDESESYRTLLHEYLAQGLSFAKAHSLAMGRYIPEAQSVLDGSNNILAINYLKARLQLGSTITPVLIKRAGPAYNSLQLSDGVASATAIRELLPDLQKAKPYLPEFSFKLLSQAQAEGRAPVTEDRYSDLALGLLRRSDVDLLQLYPEMEKGMPELFINKARQSASLAEFIDRCTSKRYPSSRIRRMLIRIILRADKDAYETALRLTEAPYLRVLGLNKDKSTLIKQWRSQLKCQLIQRPAKYNPTTVTSQKIWELDLRATDIYSLLTDDEKLNRNRQDFSHPLVII